jgi:hypothetical protein
MAKGAANIDAGRFMQLAADQLGAKMAYTQTQRWVGQQQELKQLLQH